MLHILMLVAIGLVGLGIFLFYGHMQDGRAGLVRSARSFMWLWAMVAIVNAGFGSFYAGISVLNEAVALIPIFGIPGGLAWYIARHYEVGA